MLRFRLVIIAAVVMISCVAVAQSPSAGRDLRRVQADAQPSTGAGRKLALLIANQDYREDDADLRNPKTDARLVAAALRKVGFSQVTLEVDVESRRLRRSLREFVAQVKKGDQVFFYYSGHGVALRAGDREPYQNYLLGTAFLAEDEFEAVNDDVVLVSEVVRRLEASPAAVRVVVIDACRNQPFTRSWSRSAMSQRGFVSISQEQMGQGTFLAFSARQGQRALDSAPGIASGPYAYALARYIQSPNVDVRLIFGDVGSEVRRLTKGAQFPDYRDAIDGRYAFNYTEEGGVRRRLPPSPPVATDSMAKDDGPPPPTKRRKPPPPPPTAGTNQILLEPRVQWVRFDRGQSYRLGQANAAAALVTRTGALVRLRVEGKQHALKPGLAATIAIDGTPCRWSVGDFGDRRHAVVLKDCRVGDPTADWRPAYEPSAHGAQWVATAPGIEQLKVRVNRPLFLGKTLSPGAVVSGSRQGIVVRIDGKNQRLDPGVSVAVTIDGAACKLSFTEVVARRQFALLKRCP